MSNAIGVVVSGKRAVDENAVDDSVVDVVDNGAFDVVTIGTIGAEVDGDVAGIGVFDVVDNNNGASDVVTIGTIGIEVDGAVVGRFDVVDVTTVGMADAADVVDSLVGFAVVGFFVAAVLGLSSSTVV